MHSLAKIVKYLVIALVGRKRLDKFHLFKKTFAKVLLINKFKKSKNEFKSLPPTQSLIRFHLDNDTPTWGENFKIAI